MVKQMPGAGGEIMGSQTRKNPNERVDRERHMQNEATRVEIVNSRKRQESERRFSRKARLGILAGGLVLAGVVGAVALSQRLPRSPIRARDVTERLAWYVHRGQLYADVKTFACALNYLLSSERDFPERTAATNPIIARTATATPPKS
jgi:hypothetical protein